MIRQVRQNGFSLTEALIATGILAMGLVMIAMAFPVGVKLASISTERPVGVVAANEALAKMRLYGLEFSDPNWVIPVHLACTDYWRVYGTWMPLKERDNQRCYPSLVPQPEERRYYWSALVRSINPIVNPVTNPGTKEIQVTVFVCRMLGMSAAYYDMDHTLQPTAAPNDDNAWPVPVKVGVQVSNRAPLSPKEIEIVIPGSLVYPPSGTEYKFFSEGCMIVEDRTGAIYRVMELKDKDNDASGIAETLVLDKNFVTGASVWVVPPAIGSSRNPCIDVVQTVLKIN